MPDHQLWLGTETERRLVHGLNEDDWWTRPIKPHDAEAIQALAIDHIEGTFP